jgi:hypothetical protein
VQAAILVRDRQAPGEARSSAWQVPERRDPSSATGGGEIRPVTKPDQRIGSIQPAAGTVARDRVLANRAAAGRVLIEAGQASGMTSGRRVRRCRFASTEAWASMALIADESGHYAWSASERRDDEVTLSARDGRLVGTVVEARFALRAFRSFDMPDCTAGSPHPSSGSS